MGKTNMLVFETVLLVNSSTLYCPSLAKEVPYVL
jgi:hypothetical protein